MATLSVADLLGGGAMAMTVMPTGNDPSPARGYDLLMLLANRGGRVRAEAEFRALFAAAGLRLDRVIPTDSPTSILEGVPAYAAGPGPSSSRGRSGVAGTAHVVARAGDSGAPGRLLP
jgi:hypothetical protein